METKSPNAATEQERKQNDDINEQLINALVKLTENPNEDSNSATGDDQNNGNGQGSKSKRPSNR